MRAPAGLPPSFLSFSQSLFSLPIYPVLCPLFKRLSEAHPQAVAKLDRQYRMNKDIMLLSNALIYNNALACGSEEVAEQTLKLPIAMAPSCGCDAHQSACWIQEILNERSMSFFLLL